MGVVDLEGLLVFNPSAGLVRVTSRQLIDNHENRRLPLEAMEILRKEGHYNTLDSEGRLTLSYREVYGRTIALGMLDTSLALIDSMHHVAAALIADDVVSPGQRTRIASLMKSKIMAAFISGRFTRSEFGPASFLTDVLAKKVQVKGESFWKIHGVKGVTTNAEGCDYALVSFKDEDDKSPGGALFGLVKMRNDSGGLAAGITIQDTGHTLGVPSTRSCSVEFKNVLVPSELVLPWSENSLGHFLGKNGKASFGAYTGAYIGACKKVLAFLGDKKAKYKSVIKECAGAVNGAEQTLTKAADLIDRGRPVGETLPLLLEAKRLTGLASTTLVAAVTTLGGFHDLSWDGESGDVLVFVLALFMANAHPPSTQMIEDIFEGRITLPL